MNKNLNFDIKQADGTTRKPHIKVVAGCVDKPKDVKNGFFLVRLELEEMLHSMVLDVQGELRLGFATGTFLTGGGIERGLRIRNGEDIDEEKGVATLDNGSNLDESEKNKSVVINV